MDNLWLPSPNTAIAIAAGGLVLIVVLLFVYFAASRIVEAVKVCCKIFLVLLTAVVIAALLYSLVCWAAVAHMEHHYDRIKTDMPISEVRESLGDVFFEESGVPLEELAKAGYPLDGPDGNLYAKKYSYRLWKKSCIYVIYDGGDAVRGKINACF